MIRVHIICEGATEEAFVNELMIPIFLEQGVALIPSQIGRPGHKGGNVNMPRLMVDIKGRLLADKECYCTTFLDYYGLPSVFPGKLESAHRSTAGDKFQIISDALKASVASLLGVYVTRRFIPYIQMHEFEGLLFSKPKILAQSLMDKNLEVPFCEIRSCYSTPEDVNDSPNTAPSKRIEKLFPGYDKPIHPVIAAKEMGLEAICRECPLFHGWIKRLKQIC